MPPKVFFLTVSGFVMVGLGAIGLLIPVWPTTPFMICAAACFSGTPALRDRLMRLPLFGAHIQNYRDRKGLTRRNVIASLVFLWGMLGLSCVLVSLAWVRVLLALIGAVITVHIACVARPKAQKL